MHVAALIFDFNGTLSDDEPVLSRLFRELFGRLGRPLSEGEYYRRLAGLSDREIVARWLGEAHPALDEVLAEKASRYRDLVGDGSTVSTEMRRTVLHAAGRVPVGIVSGAARGEIDAVLRAAGLTGSIGAVVSQEDVAIGKPDPSGYRLGIERLGVRAAEVVAFEDSAPGVGAAKAAGLRCIALRGTMEPRRLRQADEVVERIDVALVERLLSRGKHD